MVERRVVVPLLLPRESVGIAMPPGSVLEGVGLFMFQWMVAACGSETVEPMSRSESRRVAECVRRNGFMLVRRFGFWQRMLPEPQLRVGKYSAIKKCISSRFCGKAV